MKKTPPSLRSLPMTNSKKMKRRKPRKSWL